MTLRKKIDAGPSSVVTFWSFPRWKSRYDPSVERVRRICVEHGLERALEPKDPERKFIRKLDGKGEAQLIALCCGEVSESSARWTLRLLAERLVELEVVDSINHESVRRTL